MKIRRALISLSDKRNLDLLAAGLGRHGVEILSTGGTARALRDAGATVKDVAEHTGAPEILDGRVKTLHPKIHGGLLGRPIPEHEKQMAEHAISPIDLVVVNLYPFRETVAKGSATFGEIIENIDIGGPSMVRSAAKNHERVAVVTNPDDYEELLAEMDGNGGAVSERLRYQLARRAFAYTAAYDAAIANFLFTLGDELPGHDAVPERAPFPTVLTVQYREGQKLRYGENPHQQAAFYVGDATSGLTIAHADVLQGKELSYNNLLDLDAALQLCGEFSRPAAVIVKHNNPCGVAESDDGCAAAYKLARQCDPVSAFGGIVALNRVVDGELAALLWETFLECVIAPGFSDEAKAALAGKKNLRLLVHRTPASSGAPSWATRSVRGGLLVQSQDDQIVAAAASKAESARAATAEETRALDFAWRVCKHVKSNAIVLARADATSAVTVGIGAGQMSRVDSVKLAVGKAQSPVQGTVMASDAFFPFRDGIDAAAAAGIVAVIQPGGSMRDAEVRAAVDEHGMAMLLTGMRHFRH